MTTKEELYDEFSKYQQICRDLENIEEDIADQNEVIDDDRLFKGEVHPKEIEKLRCMEFKKRELIRNKHYNGAVLYLKTGKFYKDPKIKLIRFAMAHQNKQEKHAQQAIDGVARIKDITHNFINKAKMLPSNVNAVNYYNYKHAMDHFNMSMNRYEYAVKCFIYDILNDKKTCVQLAKFKKDFYENQMRLEKDIQNFNDLDQKLKNEIEPYEYDLNQFKEAMTHYGNFIQFLKEYYAD